MSWQHWIVVAVQTLSAASSVVLAGREKTETHWPTGPRLLVGVVISGVLVALVVTG